MVRDYYIVAPWAKRVLSVHRLGHFVSVATSHIETMIWDREGWGEAIDWEGRRNEFGVDVDMVQTQKGLPVDLESVEGGQLAHAEWLKRNGEREDRGETVEAVLEGEWVGWRRFRLWMDLFDEGDCMMFRPNAATRVSDLYRPYHGGPGKPPLKDGWHEDDVFGEDELNVRGSDDGDE